MKIKIALLGLGNIGTGVYKVLAHCGQKLEETQGLRIEMARVLVRDTAKARAVDIPAGLLTDRIEDILIDDSIGLVVECMGGIEPARTWLLAALRAGKSVVTANKMVIATCWEELDAAARASGAGLYYEASVAGGIPVIGTFNRSLQANTISEVMGIVNGTTNAILTDMSEVGLSFERALQHAQKKGYAEPDPTLDISGKDAAFKLSILASLAFGQRVRVEDVFVEGIERITQEDVAYGKTFGLTLKLLAIGRVESGRLQVRVHPAFLPSSHPLSSVRGPFNAIYLTGDALGQAMLYGRGAGDLPTASAIVSDIVMAAQHAGRHEHPAFLAGDVSDALPLEQNWQAAYYIHLRASDTPGALSQISGVLGKHGISLATVTQTARGSCTAPIIVITHPARELDIRRARQELACLDVVHDIVNIIRVEGGDGV
nr:homoserine dehydrogenase [bacterium]